MMSASLKMDAVGSVDVDALEARLLDAAGTLGVDTIRELLGSAEVYTLSPRYSDWKIRSMAGAVKHRRSTPLSRLPVRYPGKAPDLTELRRP